MHNDAVFDDGDFDNITHLGNSDKSGKVNKIGRFGVGVIVMYHIVCLQHESQDAAGTWSVDSIATPLLACSS